MKQALLPVFLFLSLQAGAQRLSAGFRTGVGFWKGEAYSPAMWEKRAISNALWEKEGFVRYESGKHFAFEAGVTSMKSTDSGEVYGLCGVGLPADYTYTAAKRIDDKYTVINLRLQFSSGDGPVKGLKNYFGVVLAPAVMTRTTTDINYRTGTGEYTPAPTSQTGLELLGGIEDRVRYRIGRHIDVHAQVGYKVNFNGTILQRGLQLGGGIAYVL